MGTAPGAALPPPIRPCRRHLRPGHRGWDVGRREGQAPLPGGTGAPGPPGWPGRGSG